MAICSWILKRPPQTRGAARRVRRFVEKPDAATAEALLAGGHSLWNAGIFMFRASALIAAFQTHAPGFLPPCRQAVAQARRDLGFLRLDPTAYDRLPEDSLDYALMEHVADVVAVPVDCGWSDLGAWDAVWREMGPDADGVAASGAVTAIDCRDALLRAEDPQMQLVGLGLEGIAVVAMRDAVLVARTSELAALKAAVARLKAEGVPPPPRRRAPIGPGAGMKASPGARVSRSSRSWCPRGASCRCNPMCTGPNIGSWCRARHR